MNNKKESDCTWKGKIENAVNGNIYKGFINYNVRRIDPSQDIKEINCIDKD